MIAIKISLPSQSEDAAVTLLWELGTAGLEVQPAASEGTVSLLVYFAVDEEQRPTLAARITGEIPQATVEPAEVPDVDWVARFRDGFRPFAAGGFRIVPAWEQDAVRDQRTLLIDPGRAFGTGTHESTRLCLLLLERLAAQGPLGRVIDVGAGTGILALAALKLGASFALAADIDAEALHSCRQHARLNDARLHLLQADGGRAVRPRYFDILLANITAPLLIGRAAELCALPTRSCVLSGILAEEADSVRAAFAAFDPNPHVERMGEWAGLLLTRRVP
jgi:ribosomal protein L11 methyltransferase